MTTHAVRLHGKYDATSHEATISDLNNGKYRIWLEIESKNYCVRTRPITIMSGRVDSLLNRQTSYDYAKCYVTKEWFHLSAESTITSSLRHTQRS